MFCRKCGEELLEDSLWCTNCGAEVSSVDSKNKTTSNDSKVDISKTENVSSNVSNSANEKSDLEKSSINDNKTDVNVSNAGVSTTDNSLPETYRLKAVPCIAGLIICSVISSVVGLLISDSIKQLNTAYFLATVIVALALCVICGAYCLLGVSKIARSLDEEDYTKPVYQEPISRDEKISLYVLSCINGFCGGIWGLLFNYNMNHRKVGISQYLVAGLYVIVLILLLVNYGEDLVFCINDCFSNLYTHWPGVIVSGVCIYFTCNIVYIIAAFDDF